MNTFQTQALAKAGRLTSTWPEKIWFGLLATGATCSYAMISAFIAIFYTNSVGISAAVVGTMMLLVRFLDGISDVIMGVVIEKTNFKRGKAVPWLTISAPLLFIGNIICFWFPKSLSGNKAIWYMYGTYIFATVIAFTIYSVAVTAALPRISLTAEDQMKTSTVQTMILQFASSIFVYASIPIMMTMFGGYGDANAWFKTALILAIVGFVLLLTGSLVIKEKKPQGTDSQKVSIVMHDTTPVTKKFKMAAKSRYFWLVLAFFFLSFFAIGLNGGVSVYYYSYIIGNPALQSLQTIIGVFLTVGAMSIAPGIYKKFGKRQVLMIASAIALVASVMRIISPSSVVLFISLQVLYQAMSGLMIAACYTYLADTNSYIARNAKIATEGVVSAFGSVGVKLGLGLSGATVGWIMGAAGFDGLAATQTSSALSAIIMLAIVAPAVCEGLKIICLALWDMDKKNKELKGMSGSGMDSAEA